MRKSVWAAILMILAVTGLSAAPAEAHDFQIFAGYYLPEELDEDLVYGLRFNWRRNSNVAFGVSGSWFDVADSQGFGGRDVDADLFHVDFSFKYYPGGGQFYWLAGPGFASADIDVPGTTQDVSDDVFSVHGGLGYDVNVTETFFVPLEGRARWYELEGAGREGGKQSQVDYEFSAGLGWRF